MAEPINAAQGRRTSDAWFNPQFLLTLGTVLAGGLLAWANLQGDVRVLDRRLIAIEAANSDRPVADALILQRLTVIETRMTALVEAEQRRQAREDRDRQSR